MLTSDSWEVVTGGAVDLVTGGAVDLASVRIRTAAYGVRCRDGECGWVDVDGLVFKGSRLDATALQHADLVEGIRAFEERQ